MSRITNYVNLDDGIIYPRQFTQVTAVKKMDVYKTEKDAISYIESRLERVTKNGRA